jgi:histone-lysine N-methyltransferase SETMAR
MSTKMIHATLHEDLNMSMKSAKWVPKLLNKEMKKEQLRTCKVLLVMFCSHSLAILNKIVTMDESAVSFHTPRQSSKASIGWERVSLPHQGSRCMPAGARRWSWPSSTKGVIYTNYVPRGTTVNANYILESLVKFLKVFMQKRPEMEAGDWWFHWDNALVHTVTVVKDWMAARQFQVIQHLPYSLDLAPTYFFLVGQPHPHPGDLQEGVGGGKKAFSIST